MRNFEALPIRELEALALPAYSTRAILHEVASILQHETGGVLKYLPGKSLYGHDARPMQHASSGDCTTRGLVDRDSRCAGTCGYMYAEQDPG